MALRRTPVGFAIRDSEGMKIPARWKAPGVQQAAEILLVITILGLPSLPLGSQAGGLAMVAGALLALIGYFLIYGEQLRNRGRISWVVMTMVVGSSVTLGLLMLLLIRGH
jgi:hypothetical protein